VGVRVPDHAEKRGKGPQIAPRGLADGGGGDARTVGGGVGGVGGAAAAAARRSLARRML
jgi:hypothetical protein